MANEAETTTTAPAPAPAPAKTPMWKSLLMWGIGLLMLFILIWVISRAWKKGQANAA